MRKSLTAIEIYSTIDENPYIDAEPTDKQLLFLSDLSDEILFGGQAGGGKSEALLMAALMYAEIPQYHAIIFRRTLSDLNLAGGLIPRAKSWLIDKGVKWNGTEFKFTFPNGSTLSFGYIRNYQDALRYKSSEYQFIGFDELTSFGEAEYLYMHSRLRKTRAMDVPLRIRSASNPGDIGHEWVKKRFITPETKHENAVFIPASMYDNPYLNHELYIDQLDKLDPVTRQQLKEGNWDIENAGEMFKYEWFKSVNGNQNHLWRGCQRVRYWDLAATVEGSKKNRDPDYTSGALLARNGDRAYYLDVFNERIDAGGIEDVLLMHARSDGYDVPIYIEQEGGAAAKIFIDYLQNKHSELSRYNITGVKSTTNKVVRAQPLSAACSNGNVHLLSGSWVPEFVRQLVVFPRQGTHDDMVDAASGAYNVLFADGISKGAGCSIAGRRTQPRRIPDLFVKKRDGYVGFRQ